VKLREGGEGKKSIRIMSVIIMKKMRRTKRMMEIRRGKRRKANLSIRRIQLNLGSDWRK